MERDPHAVVEGVAFAAYAVGATRAFIAVRANPPPRCGGCRAAVRAAEEAGYIGTDALGAGFDIHVEVVPMHRRPGRRRGDGAAARDREQARPARPASAVSRRAAGCGAGRPSSTTSRRSPPCRGSWPTARPRSPTSATTRHPGHDARPAHRRGGQAGHRRGAAGHVAAQDARRRAAASGEAKAVLVGGPAGGFLPRPSWTRSTRPRRSTRRARSWARARRRRRRRRRAWSTWPRCSSASCPTSRAARRSRAASDCAGCTRSAAAPRGTARPVDSRSSRAVRRRPRQRAVWPRVLRAQSVPDRNAILRRRVRPALRARHMPRRSVRHVADPQP